MRLIIGTYIFFGLVLMGSIYIITHTHSYEQAIVGRWQEVSWEFEKSDAQGDSTQLLTGSQKAEIWKELTIHQAELWEFSPRKKISLYDSNQNALHQMEWTIKGRGNILQIQHPDRHPENYQIQEISDDLMVMHFNFDLQVRGIVKMTFKRIES